ncbi:hypothetical protein Hsar01_02461 [Haloferula sargassicola]|uniref:Uncharacterized protein n=1 Tax=Haloferula sargassicola TaxID=490096 RepID=A0ABP9URB0_9BACT
MSDMDQIRDAAANLPNLERAELAAFLLDTLEEAIYLVDDEEVVRRSGDLDSGAVEGITREEFRRICGR